MANNNVNRPSNISKGTYVLDGLRSGPYYTRQVQYGVQSPGTITLAGNFDNYGPGVLFSAQNTWDIVPYPSTANNIAAAQAKAAAGYLVLNLAGDGFATYPGQNTIATVPSGALASTGVQFDWPRVVGLALAGAANLVAPVNVTVFGFDWYGMPMQHTYSIQNRGFYPGQAPGLPATGANAAPGNNPPSLGTPAKAFYRVSAVYCGTLAAGNTIAVQTTNIFGLPYLIQDTSVASNFTWGAALMSDRASGTSAAMAAGTTTIRTPMVGATSAVIVSRNTTGGVVGSLEVPVGTVVGRTSFVINSSSGAETSTVNWFIPGGASNIVATAVSAVSAATTGDVRGLFQLPETGETWAPVPNSINRAVLTPYVFGADQFQNQLAAMSQPQGGIALPVEVAALQTLAGAGNLVLTTTPYITQFARRITLTSANNLAAVNFTISGLGPISNGTIGAISEIVVGPNANTVTSVNTYTQINSIAASAAAAAVSSGLAASPYPNLPLVPFQTPATLFGQAQFYTGVPA